MDDRLKQGILGSALGISGTAIVRGAVSAQDDDLAAAGNGGTAGASADGGAVSIADINSGGNFGGLIGVGDTHDGAVAVDGGDVSATTTIGISSEGGVAVADASGGDGNFAATRDVDVNVFGFAS